MRILSPAPSPKPVTHEFSAATIAETSDALRIILPLQGMDLRQVYVFATPRAIVAEMRTRTTVHHAVVAVTELRDERITREFRLPVYIREGSTTVQALGDELQILCLKTKPDVPEERGWSELLRFNTRVPIGCV